MSVWEAPADGVARVVGSGITLAHGSSFAICGETGDIGGGVQGVYVGDTRIGARLKLTVDGACVEPLAWHSDEPFHAEFVGRTPAPHLLVFRDHWVGSGLRTDVRVRNPGRTPRTITVRVEVATDLAEVFDVKDGRADHGAVPATWTDGGVRLGDVSGAHGGVVRATPAASMVPPGTFTWEVDLAPRAEWSACLEWSAVHGGGEVAPDYRCGDTPAHEPPSIELAGWRALRPTLRTDVPGLARAFRRSVDDLGALRIVDPAHRSEPVVAAGAPWFMTLFGRDALLTAWMALILDPSLALTTLTTLARLQGTATVPERDEQPGRILHEVRFNSADSLALDDADIYYGTADATPLFVMLVHELWRWGTPLETLRPLLPAVDAALGWCAGPGDPDGDGYVEYCRATPNGLRNQGWKDSHDAIHFAGGELAEPPIALCEVQAYTYAAWLAGADLAEASGDAPTSTTRRARAVALKESFNRDFFLPDRQALAVALDADKRPVDSVTSNMGHCLWAGIVEPEHAAPDRTLVDGPRAREWVGSPNARDVDGALRPAQLPQRLGLAARHRDRDRRLATRRVRRRRDGAQLRVAPRVPCIRRTAAGAVQRPRTERHGGPGPVPRIVLATGMGLCRATPGHTRHAWTRARPAVGTCRSRPGAPAGGHTPRPGRHVARRRPGLDRGAPRRGRRRRSVSDSEHHECARPSARRGSGAPMNTKCEIDGCSNNAQPKLTTSGYELCAGHYEQWAGNNMFVVEESGKVVLKAASG